MPIEHPLFFSGKHASY